MADQALRDLERRAAAGDAQAALDLARARVRAGDHVAALEAVWQACAEPGLRDEAAQVTLDQAPLRSAPRVAWQARVGRAHDQLQVNPLVLRDGTALFDPATGSSRGNASGASWLDGGAVVGLRKVGRNRIVVALDAWTGEELHRTPIRGDVVGVGGGAFLVRREEQLVAYRSVGRAAPIEAWRREVPPGPLDVFVAGDTAALWHRRASPETVNTIELMAAADGATRGRIDDVRLVQLDEEGTLGEMRLDGPTLPATPVAHDRSGSLVWRLGEVGRGRLLVGRSRDRLLYGRTTPTPGQPAPDERPWEFADKGGVDLLVVDRPTGAVLGALALPGKAAAVAGEVVFHVWSDTVAATTFAGRRLWSWQAPRHTTYLPAVACLPGRVFVRTGATITCLVGDG